jgi:hypothetical protein
MFQVIHSSISPFPVTDPPRPDRRRPRARILGLAAPLVAAAALFLVAIANVQVARGRDAVEVQLAKAREATARVPLDLTIGDPRALAGDLDILQKSSARAHRGSAGLLWTVAGHANLNGGSLRTVRQEARRSVVLAAAAGPLQGSLAPLTPLGDLPGSAPLSAAPGPGPDELDQLDDLARGLNRYATAAIRVDDPSAPALERAALAAGLLPSLAGAEQPRTWTVCRTEPGPCTSVTVSSGRLGPTETTNPDPRTRDLLVLGVDPDDVFGPVTARQQRRWDASTMFALLYHLGPASISVHSVVGVEQAAIEQLAGRSGGAGR